MPQKLLTMVRYGGNQVAIGVAPRCRIIIIRGFSTGYRVAGKLIERECQLGFQPWRYKPQILLDGSQRLNLGMVHLFKSPLCSPRPWIFLCKDPRDAPVGINRRMDIRWYPHGLVKDTKIRFVIARRGIFGLQKSTEINPKQR